MTTNQDKVTLDENWTEVADGKKNVTIIVESNSVVLVEVSQTTPVVDDDAFSMSQQGLRIFALSDLEATAKVFAKTNDTGGANIVVIAGDGAA